MTLPCGINIVGARIIDGDGYEVEISSEGKLYIDFSEAVIVR